MGKVLQDDLIQLFNCMNPAAQAGMLGNKLDDALAGMLTNNNVNISITGNSTTEAASKLSPGGTGAVEQKNSKSTKII
jgi:hypothetical protein